MEIITIDGGNPHTELLTQQAFCCHPNLLAVDNTMPTVIMSTPFDRGLLLALMILLLLLPLSLWLWLLLLLFLLLLVVVVVLLLLLLFSFRCTAIW